MSNPNIPNITPTISLSTGQTVPLLLASIALEELALAHIMNAEAEKVQFVLGTLDTGTMLSPPVVTLSNLFALDASVQRTLRDVIKKEMLLEFKLENVLDLLATISPSPNCQPMIALTISSGDNACTFNISGTVTCSGQPVSSGMVTLTATLRSGIGTVTVSPNAAMITNGTFSATLTSVAIGTAEVTATTAINGVTVSTTATTSVNCSNARCGGSRLSKHQIYPPGWNS